MEYNQLDGLDNGSRTPIQDAPLRRTEDFFHDASSLINRHGAFDLARRNSEELAQVLYGCEPAAVIPNGEDKGLRDSLLSCVQMHT